MRANAKKMSRVLIPLVLAAFGLALAVFVLGASEAPVMADLQLASPDVQVTSVTVDKTDPVGCGDFVTVTARLENIGDQTAAHVTGTIDIPASLAYSAGPIPTWDFSMSKGEIIDVQWVYTCTAPGYQDPITVTVWAGNDPTPDQEVAVITQYHLTATLKAPPYVCLSENYVVTVTVANIACTGTATVTPTLATSPHACPPDCYELTPESGDIKASETRDFTTTCSCCNDQDVTFTLSAIEAVSGTQAIPSTLIYPSLPISDTVEQWKAYLVAGPLSAPATVNLNDHFTVTIPVENTGSGDASNVWPDITVTTGATCANPAAEYITKGTTVNFLAPCTCTAVSTVSISAVVTGTDVCTAIQMAPGDIEQAASITVVQKEIPVYHWGVEILEPQPGEDFVKSQTFDVQAVFTTTPPIVDSWTHPTHEVLVPDVTTLIDLVTASLVFDTDVLELVETFGPASFYLHENEEGKHAVWWRLHVKECPAPAGWPTQIEVRGETATDAKDAVVDVEVYPGHPQLKATIVKPRILQKYVSQSFSVMAIISNTCGETAIDVEATIDLDGPAELATGESATKKLGDIEFGDADKALWTVHCTGEGTVRITVTPSGTDDVSGEPIEVVQEDWIDVTQVLQSDIAVSFVAPTPSSGKKIGFESEFTIKAKIKNTGFGTLSDIFTPTLSFLPEDAIEIVGGPFEDDCATELDVPFELVKDEYKYVCWTVKCIRAEGDVSDQYLDTTFTVYASGISNICECEVEDDASRTIRQKYLIVEIIYPDPGHWFRESDQWQVTFLVTPYGYSMSGTTAKISVDGDIVIVGVDEVELGGVSEAGKEFTKFHVHCIGPGEATIRIDVTGVTGNPIASTYDNFDEVTVYQSDAPPELEVEITEPISSTWYSPGEAFIVTTTISALSGNRPPARHISATLKLTGTAEIQDPTWLYVDDDGDPLELSAGESVDTSWVVTCTGPCDVDLWVDIYWEDPTCGAYDDYAASSDEVTVHQFPLDVVIYQFPNWVESGATFDIHAKIFNLGCGCWFACEDCGVPDVYASIEIIEGPADIAPGEVYTKSIGTVICPYEYYQEAEWTVKCLRPGTVKIKVTAWTETNPFTGLPLGKRLIVYSDFVIVDQLPRLIGYEIQLCKHWNYLSLPLIPPEPEIDDVLGSVKDNVVEVYWWNPETGDWELHVPGKPESYYTTLGKAHLLEMDDGKGYIISMNYPDILEDEGYEDPPEFTSPPLEYELAEGWNLVGFKTRDFVDTVGMIDATDNMTAGHYLKNLLVCDGCDSIVGGNARFLRTYDCGYPGDWRALTSDDDPMTVGRGYWLYASLPDLSIVPPITQK